MADHLRKQIRDALVTAVTGLTTTGARVYKGRAYAVESQDLPCLLVYTGGETVSNRSLPTPRLQDREVEFVVEALATAVDSSLDDSLDLICKEVEVALADNSFSGKSKGTGLKRVGAAEIVGGDSAKPIGAKRMVWGVHYAVRSNAPDTSI